MTKSTDEAPNYAAPLVRADLWPGLTSRETDVALLLCDGHPCKVIAGMLEVSVKTIDTHRHHILEKTQCANTVALLRWAISWGLVVIPPALSQPPGDTHEPSDEHRGHESGVLDAVPAQ